MKLYPHLNVTVNYQNFGSAWLIILRGKTEDIDLAFNSLFNLCATNGKLEFPEQTKTVATFWSDETNFRRYWLNRYEYQHPELGRAITKGQCQAAIDFANGHLTELREKCHEFFRMFEKGFMPDTYSTGTTSAERPDTDFKDAVLIHAHTNKSE